MGYIVHLCLAVNQTVMGAIQFVVGDKLPHTTKLKDFQLALQWVIWIGLVVIVDFEGVKKEFYLWWHQ